MTQEETNLVLNYVRTRVLVYSFIRDIEDCLDTNKPISEELTSQLSEYSNKLNKLYEQIKQQKS